MNQRRSNFPITGVMITDLDGRVLRRSESLAKLLGRSNAEVVGRVFSADWFTADSLEKARAALLRCLGAGSVSDLELACLDTEGREVRVWVDCSLVTDSQGHPVNITCVLKNEAAREQALAALTLSEAKYRLLFDSAPEAILLMMPDAKIIDCNPVACSILGVSKEQVTGKSFFRLGLVQQEDLANARREFDLVLSGAAGTATDYCLHFVGREPIWIECFLSVLSIDGIPQILQMFFRDVTSERKASELLKRGAERLRCAVENMPVMVDAFDDDGAIIVWNRECERVSGYSAAEIVGNPEAMELLYPEAEYREKMMAEWKRRTDNYRGWVWKLTCKDGSRRMIAWSNESAIHPIPGWASWGVGIDVTEQLDAERRLSIAHHDLNQIFQAAMPMNVIGSDFTILRINQTYMENFCVSEDDVIGKKCYDVFPGPLCNTSECAMMQILGGNDHYVYEDNTSLPDGRVVTSLVSAVPYRGNDGEIIGIVESFADISERKKSEAALRESETRFRELANLLPQFVFETDTGGNYTFANRCALELTGYTQEDIDRGTNLRQLFSPGTLRRATANFSRVLSGEKLGGNEYELLTKNGSTLPVKIYSTPIVRGGAVVGTRGIAIDLRAEKEAAAKVKATEEKYRALFESSPKGITQVALDGTILDCNPATCDLAGLSKEQLVGGKFFNLKALSSAERQRCLKAFEALKQGQEAESFELVIPTADGRSRWTESFSSLIKREGHPDTILIFTHDITDRKEAEKTAIELEERYRTLQANLPIGIIRTTPEGKILTINPAGVRMLGFSSDEDIRSKRSVDFYADPSERVKGVEELARRGSIRNLEVLLVRKDGSKFWAELDARGVADETGRLTHYDASIADITDRKMAEAALRASEETLRSQYQSIPLPTYTWECVGDDFILVDFNNAAVLITQGKIADYKGSKVSEMYADQPQIVSDLGKCFTTKKNVKREMLYHFRTLGEDRYLSVNYAYVPPRFVMVHTEDITVRKQAEDSLRRSEEKYRSLVEGASDAIFTVDCDGRIMFLNTVAAQRLELPRDEVIGKTIQELFPKDIAEEQLANIQEVLRAGKGKMFDSVTVLRGRNYRYLTSIQPLKDERGNANAVVCIARDVSEIMHIKQELRSERDFVRSLLDTANSLIVCLNAKAEITIFNRECEKVTGYSREEVLGRSWPALFLPEEHHHPGLKRFAEWVSAHPHDMYEGPLKIKSGEIRTILWSNSALLSDNSEEIIAIAVGQDITDRKLAEEALADSEEKYRMLVENVDTVIVRLDGDGVVQFVNEHVARQLRQPASAIVGRPLAELFPEEVAEEQLGLIRQVIEKGKPIARELYFPVNGKWRWHFTKIQPYKDPEGRINGALIIADDVTERKETQQELELAHGKLKAEQESLRQVNITLRQLIGNVEAEKDSIKRQIQDNIDKVLMPLLSKLKSRLEPQLQSSVTLLEECFVDIATPYLNQLSLKSMSLTNNELRICLLIAKGLRTKDVAVSLGVSSRTIEKHRQQIRRKLGLTRTSANLQSYLISIRSELATEEKTRKGPLWPDA